MINVDMVGRMVDEKVIVYGTRSAAAYGRCWLSGMSRRTCG